MFRFIIPIILIGIAIAGFFTFVNPIHKEVVVLQAQVDSYNKALDNSKALGYERDKLTKIHNSLDLKNLNKLKKLLPDNVDNIRLILEIEKIASPYGMVLKDVKYNATSKDTPISQASGATQAVKNSTGKDYSVWNLEFSIQGTYNNFTNFVKDLENNLRIVDISSIQFSSNAGAGISPSLSESYKYNFKIKTYWLKN